MFIRSISRHFRNIEIGEIDISAIVVHVWREKIMHVSLTNPIKTSIKQT